MNIDWKAKYFRLAGQVQTLLDSLRNNNLAISRIEHFLEEGKRDDLYERNKVKLVRLTKDVEVAKEYDRDDYFPGTPPRKPELFKKGTLIEATLTSSGASVYLDEDGDGYLRFPNHACEEVELDMNEVHDVIRQG
jgi:hypothetical protein